MTLSKEHKKNLKREMRKDCLMDILKKTAVGACILGSITGGVYLGRSEQRKQDKLIHSYTKTIDYPVSQGDTYWNYAKNLQEQYPELRGLNVNNITRKIQELNGNKELNYSDSVKIPVYNSSIREASES